MHHLRLRCSDVLVCCLQKSRRSIERLPSDRGTSRAALHLALLHHLARACVGGSHVRRQTLSAQVATQLPTANPRRGSAHDAQESTMYAVPHPRRGSPAPHRHCASTNTPVPSARRAVRTRTDLLVTDTHQNTRFVSPRGAATNASGAPRLSHAPPLCGGGRAGPSTVLREVTPVRARRSSRPQ